MQRTVEGLPPVAAAALQTLTDSLIAMAPEVHVSIPSLPKLAPLLVVPQLQKRTDAKS
jgi:hypothetical protein